MVDLRYKLDNNDTDALNVLSDEGKFVSPDGTAYKAGTVLLNEDNSLYTLIVAIPKEIDVLSLKFVFGGQTLLLKQDKESRE
jgi:hypothetical protein